MKPEVEYDILEVESFFRNECVELRTKLKSLVEEGSMKPIDARIKYDMYLNTLFYLEICIASIKHDDFSGENNFNDMYRYIKSENNSLGSSKLDKVFDSIS